MAVTVRVPPGVDVRIDDRDVGLLLVHSWTANLDARGHWRVWAWNRGRAMHLSREIVRRSGGKLRGLVVDHKNGNTLDNRRDNLRSTTTVGNARNLGGCHRDNPSKYLGVSWHSASGKWQARIKTHDKQTYLGLFDTAEAAHLARLKAEREMWGVEPRRAAAHAEVSL